MLLQIPLALDLDQLEDSKYQLLLGFLPINSHTCTNNKSKPSVWMQVIPRILWAGRSSEQAWLGFADKAIISAFDRGMLQFEKLRTVAASIFSRSDSQDLHLFMFNFKDLNSEDGIYSHTNVDPRSLPMKSLYLTGFEHPHEHQFNSKISHDAICFTRAVHFQGMLDAWKVCFRRKFCRLSPPRERYWCTCITEVVRLYGFAFFGTQSYIHPIILQWLIVLDIMRM